MNSVVVVDYGAGNTRSVRAALTHLGRDERGHQRSRAIGDAEFVSCPASVRRAARWTTLNDSGAATALCDRFRDGGAILGICLGLQLAMEHSEEDGGVTGLGLLSGDVVRLRRGAGAAPRVGRSWSRGARLTTSPTPTPCAQSDAVASVDGVTVAVRRDAFLGVQFHPEKSGPAGLAFLDQCLSLA